MSHHVIQTFPNEILEIILDNCCDTNLFSVDDDEESVGSLKDIPAMAVSSVCSQWRRVGLSLSRIWSRMSLDLLGDLSTPEEDRLSPILRMFITRSRQQPITLSICLGSPLNPDICPYEPLAILCREYHRWASFTLRSEDWDVDDLFSTADYSLPREGFTRLVHLELGFSPSADFFVTFKAPSLQKLKLSSENKSYDDFEIQLLSQLTHLQLNKEIWSLAVLKALRQITSLQSLDVDDHVDSDWDMDWPEDGDDEAFSFPTSSSIEVLTIRHSENDSQAAHITSIFPLLDLPSLTTLRLDCGQDSSDPRKHLWPSFDPFMAFVKRSSFTLTTLYIKCVALSDSKLIYLLYHIPTLLDLTVVDPIVEDGENGERLIPLTGQFLQSLHVGTASLLQLTTPLVPKLRCLTLNVGGCFFDDKAALDLVKSRWTPHGSKHGVDCLRSFTIIFRARTNVPEAYDTLNDFAKAGMKIAVFCFDSVTRSLTPSPRTTPEYD
ncbi:hypothetical protein BDP27DRAFT_1328585 [Rhodocollybia butyracea]|uniref:F-box domain-containing protein n=1 Tax=Rhodocollybia butyracea TaxID=206335 RepID=A0A9P5PQX4_9AGAR|nr:hypothetical protein BDP27DRAFT_1328585 [Rhodocollybia butyracea]